VEVLPPLSTLGTLQVGGTVGRGKSTGQGAAEGAGSGFVAGAGVGFQASMNLGPLAPIAWPFFVAGGAVGGTIIGGTSGAVAGFVNSVPEKLVKDLEALLAENKADLSAELLPQVRERLLMAGKGLVEPGAVADLQLAVSIPTWGLYCGTGGDPMTTYSALVNYRLSEPGGQVIQDETFEVGGAIRPLTEWRAGAGEHLQKAMLDAVQSAAEAVTDAVLLIQDFQSGGIPVPCGLTPLKPGPMLWPGDSRFRPVPSVDGLLPTFRWEAFPRGMDRRLDGGPSVDPFTDVRYDLRIWTSLGGGPGERVYERLNLVLESHSRSPAVPGDAPGGLPAASANSFVEHRLEVPLAPNSEYLWSVRAHFRLDGEARATRWSALDPPPKSRGTCRYDGIPLLRFHRFKTP
jgi:hypothetical protein